MFVCGLRAGVSVLPDVDLFGSRGNGVQKVIIVSP